MAHRHYSRVAEASIATVPILLFGTAWTIQTIPGTNDSPPPLRGLGFIILVFAYFYTLAGFAVGWSRGFPRWSMPFLGITIMFTWYWSNVATPAMTIFGYRTFGREVWGARAWVPFLIVSAVVFFVFHFRVDWTTVQKRFRNDWTLPLFAAYAPAFMLVSINLDEIRSAVITPAMAVGMALLCIGALAYMLIDSGHLRSFVLGGFAYLAVIMTGLVGAIYWDGRQERWMQEPADGLATFLSVACFGAIALVIVGGAGSLTAQALARMPLTSHPKPRR